MNVPEEASPAGIRAVLLSPVAIRICRTIFAVVVAVVFVFGVEALVGWRSVVYPWRFIEEPRWIVVGAALVGTSYVIRAIRLFRFFELDYGFRTSLRLVLQQNLLNNLLPFRTGEFAFPVLMNRYLSVPPSRSVPGLLWLRMLDLHALLLVLISVVGVVVSPAAGALAVPVWIAAVFIFRGAAFWLAAALPEARNGIVLAIRGGLEMAPTHRFDLLELLFWTLANWLLKLLAFAWVIRLFTAAPFDTGLAGAVGGELAAVLPIQGLAGLGTYEAGVVAAMQALGSTLNEALTGAVTLHLFLLGVSILGGLASFLFPARRQAEATG